MRWLFYASNGWGLGHLVQTIALARQVRRLAPESEILFLTNSEATDILWQEGFASVKLISQEAQRQCGSEPMRLRWIDQVLTMNAFAAFRPEVTVVDCFPMGWTNELAGILRFQPRRVFVCREKVKGVRELPGFQQNLKAYHRIIVPHLPGEIEMPLPGGMAAEWTGYMLVRSAEEGLSRQEARRRLGLPAEGFIVYVGFGGGGDAEYDKLLDWVLGHAAEFPRWTFAVSAPPLYRPPPRRSGALARREGGPQSGAASGGNVVRFSYYPLAECWAAFDGAVSALGLNTTAELLHQGVPALYLPRKVTEDDHLARARRITDNDAGWLVAPFDSEALRARLKDLAEPATRARLAANARAMVPENGAERAARHLLAWIAEEARA